MSENSKYQESLDFLYSFIDYSLSKDLRYSPEKFNLDRMRHLMRLLGNPEDDYKIIHVAGTKGKGSICAMVASILTQAGYKTGFYSSPHMIDFTERIRIGNQLISHQQLVDYVEYLKPYIYQVDQITTFEITTALAFKYFSDQKVNFAVVEVGLGGRFDATNIVSPMISVISTISHDHTKILGKTLAKIAFEKSGIIKQGIPVVISKQKKSALDVIKKITDYRGAQLIMANKIYEIKSLSKNLEFQEFGIGYGKKNTIRIKTPLIGSHQLENAITTFAVIDAMRKRGIEIQDRAIREGFEQVKWPGRFEVLAKDPLVIIDGAHNPASMRYVAKTIQEYLPGKEITLVFGISEDKDVTSMLKIIHPHIHHLIITRSLHPRAMEVDRIKNIADSIGINSFITQSVEAAYQKAKSLAGKNSVIIATGSIFIAGAFREIYYKDVLAD